MKFSAEFKKFFWQLFFVDFQLNGDPKYFKVVHKLIDNAVSYRVTGTERVHRLLWIGLQGTIDKGCGGFNNN